HSHLRFVQITTLVAATLVPTYAATITDTYAGSLPATFTGTLPDQGSVFLETFTLSAPGNVTVFTTSYATGGFQTNLLLFNSSGTAIAGSVPAGLPDVGTGIVGDSLLTAMGLGAGTYTVALTDFLLGQSLVATNLSDGFTFNLGNGTT
ncbi:DVUA0089 family protein, partial [Bradyrhizobium sp. NBAIM08]|uniref:DVUA0089 family protein n=1 Tax=Bradyrhizobium sp. NBAIM08 TaxID=2793815 RepID=UPI001CD41DC3